MFPSPSEWPNPGRYHCAGLVGKVSFWSPRMLPAPWTLKFRFESWTAWTTIFLDDFLFSLNPNEILFGGFNLPHPGKMMEWKSVGMMTFPTERKVIIHSCSKAPTRSSPRFKIGSTMSPRKFRVESWTTIFFRPGWWFQPLWKNMSQLGLLFPLYGKIKFMFQTTNQHVIYIVGLVYLHSIPPILSPYHVLVKSLWLTVTSISLLMSHYPLVN